MPSRPHLPETTGGTKGDGMRKPARPNRGRIVAAVLVLLSLAAAGLALSGLSDFDLDARSQRELTFGTAGATLSGTLVLPDGTGERPHAVALIVHGDGPQDRWSNGGYLPLVNALLDKGIAVYSWDKPGVGASGGDWLDQSMRDRSEETRAAWAAVAQALPQARGRIGFLGFSQAGWVLPAVAAQESPKPAFVALVGGAVSWQRQGDYFTTRRLEGEGWTREKIAQHLIETDRREEEMFAALAAGTLPEAEAARHMGVTAERLAFIRRNRHADASDAIAQVDAPFLAVWGAEDLNVDPQANAGDYRRQLPPSPRHRIEVLPGATHGLLRADLFGYQLTDAMPWHAKAAFLLLGRKAYAEGAIPLVGDWIVETAKGAS